ncbi:MAG TPA: hypothetical protein VF572_02055 [Candidatus Saccharimonadales bacterium]|jgi:hypothetical protein
MSVNQTWTNTSVYVIDGFFEVPSGKVLTIQAGTIVKYSANANGITVLAGGTLNATGTSTSRVIFTSLKDDSVGGDSDNNGVTSGSYGNYYYAVMNYGGTVTIKYANMRNATTALYYPCNLGQGIASINDSLLSSNISYQYCDPGKVILRRNTFSVPVAADSAVQTQNSDMSGLILSGTDKNIFNGVGRSMLVHTVSSRVSAGQTWTVDSTSKAVLSLGLFSVAGVMNVNAGVIVKVPSNSVAMNVESGGTLNATGTSTSRVVFTSLKDDSVGGDSEGNGATVGAYGNYAEAIINNGGTVSLNYTNIRNASTAFYYSCLSGSGNVVINDSLLSSTIIYQYCDSGKVSLRRNTFSVPAAADYAVQTQNSDMSGLILSGTDKNIFNGTGRSLRVYAVLGRVSAGQTWTVDGTSKAVLSLGLFDVNGTLNLGAGTIVKVPKNAVAISVSGSGLLNTTGTSTSRVLFTSLKDDSVGGDTDGNGVSSGAVFDYDTAIVSQDGQLNLNNTTIDYAGTALNIAGVEGKLNVLSNLTVRYTGTGIYQTKGETNITGGDINNISDGIILSSGALAYRGKFNAVSHKAIQSCPWLVLSCQVDASYVDWGQPEGPAGSTTVPSLVCGQVLLSPWISGGVNHFAGVFSSGNCSSLNPRPSENLSASTAYFDQRMLIASMDCSGGMNEACDAMQSANSCAAAAVNLAGTKVPFSTPLYGSASNASTWSNQFVSSADDYYSAEAEVTVTGVTVNSANLLITALETFNSLSDAYYQCSP